MHQLENDLIEVKIKEDGAELCSIIDKSSGIQHVWQADPEIWGRHAPVLFPIVGQVNNGEYRVNESTYKLSQHGFARDQKFNIVSKSDNKIEFELSYNENSLKVYPFKFKLSIIYTLEGKKLTVEHKVTNVDTKEMLYSIGAHPGFVCPFYENENFTNYYLEFEQEETLGRIELTPSGLRSGVVSEGYLVDQKEIPMKLDIFLKDAIIVENFKSSFIDLKSRSNNTSLRFGFKNYPHLGIWSKPGAPYICIEPWQGMADEDGYTGEFKSKKGVVALGGDQSNSHYHSVELI